MPSTIPQNATEKFQKSIGSSVKSLFNPGTRTYFVLEHKTNSEKHRVGESSNFLSDYVEIGRGDKYAVNFGDDCKSVSRPHAAISRKGSGWMLTPISKTNATFVNGRTINSDITLSNGDEIQFSNNGPKLSFLVPSNPSIKTLGFTVRFKAAMNEAVRPYKTTIGILSVIFILLIAGLTYGLIGSKKDIEESNKKIAETQEKLRRTQEELKIYIDSTSKLMESVKKIKFPPPQPPVVTRPYNPDVQPSLSYLYPNVYYIVTDRIETQIEDKRQTWNLQLAGTGFLLNDGRFVTARHVVEPWMFIQDTTERQLIQLNLIANNGGKVIHHIVAISSTGERLELTNDEFVINKSSDKIQEISTDEGSALRISTPTLNDGTDWAFYKTSKTGGLQFDEELSKSLSASSTLDILGYPHGERKPFPKHCTCDVALDGLDNNMIDIGNIGIEHGNSGGPVFLKNSSGKHIVIGIVSTSRSHQGGVVPISNVPKS